MFNSEFYPTPTNLIDKMLSGINFKEIESVLEPSAGKGDLACAIGMKMDRAKNCWSKQIDYSGLDIDTIEIDPELRHILKGHGLRIVHDDFLSYVTFKRYDLIVMNPPFSNGDKHLLKAIDIQKHGGNVICLLNAETLKNPYTNARKELLQKLENYNAEIEYLTDAFMSAERKTSVEVALIKVSIPKENDNSIILESLRKEQSLSKEQEQRPEYGALIDNDFIRGIVSQYNFEVHAGLKLIDEYKAMCPYILDKIPDPAEKYNYCDPILDLRIDNKNSGNLYNQYIKKVRQKYWEALFRNPEFTALLTSNLKSEYLNRVNDLVDYDFSLYNIYTIRCEMNAQMCKGVEETILSLFDELSHKHYWDDQTSKNIHYYNGWKTNKAYKINKKVIIPLNAYGYFGDLNYDHAAKEKLSDIEKVFNYLDGGITDSINIDTALKRAQAHGVTQKIALKYFHVSFYKKGTCHIEFDNLELLKKFNIFGSQRKGWLPPSYGKSTYKEMTKEEQSIVDEFDGGESKYSEVLLNQAYSLSELEQLPMLQAAV